MSSKGIQDKHIYHNIVLIEVQQQSRNKYANPLYMSREQMSNTSSLHDFSTA